MSQTQSEAVTDRMIAREKLDRASIRRSARLLLADSKEENDRRAAELAHHGYGVEDIVIKTGVRVEVVRALVLGVM